MITRRRFEPNDPPPDLAIEIDVTSKTTLDAIEAIAVLELWVYASQKLSVYLLQDGKYLESNTSPIFPNVPIAQIIPAVVERACLVGSVQALEEFAATI